MGKHLDKYMKKTGKVDPFKGAKGGTGWKGSKGAQMSDQYAETSGRKITEDGKAEAETDPATNAAGAFASSKSKGGKKPRPYLNC